MYTKIKTPQEINSMRKAGKICSLVLGLLKNKIKPGMTTKDLAVLAQKEIKALGGKPAFLGYSGFPDVICISVNDEVVHGIPKQDKIINSGDIVSLDLGITYEGMIVDSAISLLVDSDDKVKINLLNTTEESLKKGLQAVKDGSMTGNIGNAVEAVLNRNRYGVIRELVGHGVGHQVHEDPNIPNYGAKGTGEHLKAGMTIAIEPMATLGGESIVIDSDGWTVKTQDKSLSAHFEQTVLITKNGYEVLTPFPQ